MAREVVSLQVGGLSNWVGAHLWNLDNASETPSEALYVDTDGNDEARPRLVAFDLRGRQGALFADEYAAEGGAEAAEKALLAAGAFGVTQHVAEPLARNPYLAALPGGGGGGGGGDDDDDDDDDNRRRLESGGGRRGGAAAAASSFFGGDDDNWNSYGSSGFAERAHAMLMGHNEDNEGVGADTGGANDDDDDDDDDDKEEEEEEPDEVGWEGAEGRRGGDAVSIDRLPERWSEFIEVRLQQRSLMEVPFWDVRNGPFSSFAAGNINQGGDCALSVDEREDAFDRLRLVLEECDHVQGWQCVVDAQGGFGGLASSVVAEARDQCGSAAIGVSLLLDPPEMPTDEPMQSPEGASPGTVQFDSQQRRRARAQIDEALALHGLLENASVVLPLRMGGARGGVAPGQAAAAEAPASLSSSSSSSSDKEAGGGENEEERMNPAALLHESAVLATCVDTATLPYRRPAARGRAPLMGDWASILSPRGDLRVLSASMHLARAQGAVAGSISSGGGGGGGGGSSSPASVVVSLLPVPPSVLSTSPPHRGRWSCLMSGRGVLLERWPGQECSATRFSFEAVALPLSFPRFFPGSSVTTVASSPRFPPPPPPPLPSSSKKARVGAGAANSQGGSDSGGPRGDRTTLPSARTTSVACLVNVGCSDALRPYLAGLAAPLHSIRSMGTAGRSAAEAARRAGGIDAEDLEAIAEDLESLTETYSAT